MKTQNTTSKASKTKPAKPATAKPAQVDAVASTKTEKPMQTLFRAYGMSGTSLVGRAMYYAIYALQMGVSEKDAIVSKFPVGKSFKAPDSAIARYWVAKQFWIKAAVGHEFTPAGAAAFAEYSARHQAIPEMMYRDAVVAVTTGKNAGEIKGSWVPIK